MAGHLQGILQQSTPENENKSTNLNPYNNLDLNLHQEGSQMVTEKSIGIRIKITVVTVGTVSTVIS